MNFAQLMVAKIVLSTEARWSVMIVEKASN